MVDFTIAFVVLVGMILFYGIIPTTAIWTLPFFIAMAVLTALGVGLWLSALNVQYRDVRYAIPFWIQFWLFATPIAYSSSRLSEPWRAVYGLNPMAGVVEGLRWALLGKAGPNFRLCYYSVGLSSSIEWTNVCRRGLIACGCLKSAASCS